MLERTDNFIAKLDAKSAELEAIKARKFHGLSIKSDTLAYKGQTFPIAGAKATIESAGIAQSRMTATRVIGGAALFGGTGAVIGAVGRKDKSTIFLTIELADGAVLVEEFPVKKEGDARRFVAQFNTTAARTRQPAPTPQPVAQTPQPVPRWPRPHRQPSSPKVHLQGGTQIPTAPPTPAGGTAPLGPSTSSRPSSPNPRGRLLALTPDTKAHRHSQRRFVYTHGRCRGSMCMDITTEAPGFAPRGFSASRDRLSDYSALWSARNCSREILLRL